MKVVTPETLTEPPTIEKIVQETMVNNVESLIRDNWLKKMYVTNFRSYVELTFNIEGSNKLM